MSDAPEPTISAGTMPFLARTKEWASLVRDVGIIIGLPVVLTIGVRLYDLQTKALESQVKANEAQIKVVEAQNALLKETQYDRALSLLTAQKEVFEIERRGLEKRISDYRSSGVARTEYEDDLLKQLKEKQSLVNSSDTIIRAWENCRRGMAGAFSPVTGPNPACDPMLTIDNRIK